LNSGENFCLLNVIFLEKAIFLVKKKKEKKRKKSFSNYNNLLIILYSSSFSCSLSGTDDRVIRQLTFLCGSLGSGLSFHKLNYGNPSWKQCENDSQLYTNEKFQQNKTKIKNFYVSVEIF